jgi:midasin (ATPase involved in ribosome maturation)
MERLFGDRLRGFPVPPGFAVLLALIPLLGLPELAARGESPAAVDRRCISPGCVVHRSNTTGILPLLALPDERITGLGATLADLTNHGFITLDLDGQSDVAQLIGQHVPVEGQDRYAWLDGRLTQAMHSGSWILIDEMNLAAPEILERLNSLLDDDGSLTIHEHCGEKWVPAPVYRAFEAEDHDLTHLRMIHPEFRLFAAMNAEPHPGRATMSAMLNKFYQVWVPQHGTVEEEERIVGDYLTAGAQARDGWGTTR